MPRPTLSVCILTKDIAHFLPEVLRNVEGVGDELVVVDSLSTDGTAELLKAHPKVRLVSRAFSGSFGEQKNFAFSQCRCDWILNLDQDELLGDELRGNLPKLIDTRRYEHFKLPRYWLLGGPPWRYVHSDKHYPDWSLRLFRNLPGFRFAPDQLVHHHFPKDTRGRGRKSWAGHIFHFDFLLKDGKQRQEKYELYMRIDPTAANTHRMSLYESYDFSARPCKEPLSGVAWRSAGVTLGS